MGTVGNLANQVNNLSPCTSQNCCQKIDELQGEIIRMAQLVKTLENQSGKADDALRTAKDALSKINPLRDEAAYALRIGEQNGTKVDELGTDVLKLIVAVGVLTKAVGALTSWIANVGSQLAVLIPNLPQLLLLVGSYAATKIDIEAAKIAADSAYKLAETAMRIGSIAGDQAATAILRNRETDARAQAAQGSANNAQNTADRALGAASNAQSTADRAAGAASNAQSTADRAAGAASNAQRTADAAAGAAGKAQSTADRAAGAAEIAQSTADFGVDSASNAQSTADRAAGAAGKAQRTADVALTTATSTSTKVERATSTAENAQSTAQEAIDIAQTVANRPQIQGKQGERGLDGRPGKDGKDGKNGEDGKEKIPGWLTPYRVETLEAKVESLTQRTNKNDVNSADKAEILQAVQGVKSSVLDIPVALVANPQYKEAITSAAATGSCRSSRPGGCSGGIPDQIDGLKGNFLNALNTGLSGINTTLLTNISPQISQTLKNTTELIKRVGDPIAGGLSAWATATAEVVNRSQILNVLTYISVLHNAYMLSGSIGQTLFSAVGNILSALGIKDTSKDPAGTPWDVGAIVGQWTEGFFKLTFGVEVVEGIKADWKKYNRIYQAAANILYSVQSLSHSILGALEVVGSHVAKIGNALQKFRAVGERAYGWMNDRPFFQNRLFTFIQSAQEGLSVVDQAASTVVSIQEQGIQIGKNTEELQKSIAEDPAGKKSEPTPEAADTKAKAEAAKLASKSPDISEADQIKP